MKTIQGIVKINLKQSKTSYIIMGILLLLAIASTITAMAFVGSGAMPWGDYLFLLPPLMAIFIPAQNFSKLMSLGCSRLDFFKGCILTYASVSAAVTVAVLLLHYTVDSFILVNGEELFGLLNVFGFAARGPVAAFFQTCAFLLLFSCAAHTLTLVQGRWYGWVIDTLIIAIISVFTPIAPLRAALAWFFNMIIFHDIAVVQILSCLILGAAVYCASLIPIRSKQI